MSTITQPQHNNRTLLDLMRGLLVVAIVVAVLGVAALWVARLGLWAAGTPAAAAPVEQFPSAPAPSEPSAPVAVTEVLTPALTPEAAPAVPVEVTPTTPLETPVPAETVAPEETVVPAEPAPVEGSEYVVRDGDTLSAIAAAFGLPLDELASANGLTDPNFVYVGQTLLIPGADSAVVVSPTETPATPSPTPEPPAATAEPVFVPADPVTINEARWVDVDLSEQRLTAYEGQTPVRTTLVSTGLPGTPTVEGQFRIYIMLRYDDMAGPGYYIKDVPFVMYFFEGYGLHGVTWHANFGHPMSHGCVNMPTEEAEWLFNWAEMGTLVNVHA